MSWLRLRFAMVTVGTFVVLMANGLPLHAAAGKATEKSGGDDVVVVEATGEGLSKEEATKVALRNALEQGGKSEIFSDTQVENFQLMHDTIITRAEGIVTDYKVLEEKKVIGGTFKVKIRAKVSKKALVDSWGAIQNVLNQIGRPKIMVYVVERIDGKTEDQSILETEIEKRLLNSGFDLIARSAVKAIIEKEKADAAAENDVAKLQAIAKQFDAHIFITGTANANQAGLEDLYGTPAAFYNCDVQVKAYYTDSAKLLASAGIPVSRGGARGRKEFSPQAGKMALSFAGQNLVEEIYQQVMRQWSTQISAGGEIILEVQGMKVPGALKLKKKLVAIEGVERVHQSVTKGLAKFRINAKLSAEDLAGRLVEGEFEKILEITDLQLNRIQSKAVGK